MNVYLGKVRQNVTQMMTATHVTVRSLTRREEDVCHECYMDNFFFSPDISDALYTRGINCCGTVTQNHEGMAGGLDRKTLKLKQSDMCAKLRCNPMAVVWKDE
jgi:hypothetical protein